MTTATLVFLVLLLACCSLCVWIGYEMGYKRGIHNLASYLSNRFLAESWYHQLQDTLWDAQR